MVAFFNLVVALVATALAVEAAPIDNTIEKRAGGCSSYVIINTRGTGEMQGQSSGFRTMNKNVMAKKSGGSIYNTKYSAGITQMSAKGTADIVSKVSSTLSSNPNTCIILEGYSQGAAATTNALPKLTGKNFDAVKGVFLIGNPMHRKGKACNVDTKGGKSTLDVNGMSATLGGIPDNWISKTMDVCNYGDGVCDTKHGFGINMQHLAYPTSSSTQSMGAEFILKQLNGASSAAGSAAADCTDAAPAASSKSKRQFGGLDKLKGMFGGGASASSEGSESTEASASTEGSAAACSTPASGGAASDGAASDTAASDTAADGAATASTGASGSASTGADASVDAGADTSADAGADAGGGSRLDKLKSMFGGGAGGSSGGLGRLKALRSGSAGGMGGLSKLRGMGGGMGGLSKLRGTGGA